MNVHLGESPAGKNDVGVAAASFAAIIGGVIFPYLTAKEVPMPVEFRNVYRTHVKWKKPTRLGTAVGFTLLVGGIVGLVYTGGKL